MTTSTLVRPGRPGAPAANSRRRRLALCAVIVILVVSNVVSNRVWPQAYVPWNLAVAAVLLVIARQAGLSWADLGLSRRRLRRGLWIGALAVGLIVAVYLTALAIPVTREAFVDQRAAGPLTAALLAALVRIPLGTVMLEEIAFRGVLPALVNGGDEDGFWRGALVSSALFGLWHVLPSLGMSASNAAVGAALGGWSVVGQAGLAVLATAAAGVLMMLWRRWSGHLVTPVLSHIATNSLGVLIAWWLVSGGS